MPRRRRRLSDELGRVRPDLPDPRRAIADGRVTVDGVPVTNPSSLVAEDAAIVVRRPRLLRGTAKLRAALDAFGVAVAGRVALDVGAAAGGFTQALLDAGAARVYAVDVGHGQLLGSLRQDTRVVTLEAVNLAHLDRRLVAEPVEIVTIDVSYLSLADAVPQLDGVELAPGADLLGLVKPMFELRLDSAPTDRARLDTAIALAAEGIRAAGWTVVGDLRSGIAGAKGAVEGFVHARKEPEGV